MLLYEKYRWLNEVPINALLLVYHNDTLKATHSGHTPQPLRGLGSGDRV